MNPFYAMWAAQIPLMVLFPWFYGTKHNQPKEKTQ